MRQALVLQQLPGRMWRALGFAPAKLRRKIFERAADINVSFRFSQQTDEVPAKSLNVVHTVVRFDSKTGPRVSPLRICRVEFVDRIGWTLSAQRLQDASGGGKFDLQPRAIHRRSQVRREKCLIGMGEQAGMDA